MMRRLTPLLVLLGLGLLGPASAHAGWSAGPDMLQPRTGAAAALLHDGGVLMMGGRLYDGGFAGVERLDPGGRAWAPTGSLATSRTDTTAVTLPDGSVLAVGGWHWNPTDSERYDPLGGRWSASARRFEGWNTPVVELYDGRVLAVGGEEEIDPLGWNDVFDPVAGTWSGAATDLEITEGHSATLLKDGRVLVAGGRSWLADYFWWYTPEARVYDPATDAWSRVAAMPQPRAGHLAERLLDGRVLVLGGANDEVGRLSGTLLYDPGADRWAAAAPLPADFRPQASVRLRDGSVLVVGDYDPDTGITASMRYDPATDAWSEPDPLVEHRGWGFTATLLADGRVLVAGGFRPQVPGFSRTTELWTPPCPPHPSGARAARDPRAVAEGARHALRRHGQSGPTSSSRPSTALARAATPSSTARRSSASVAGWNAPPSAAACGLAHRAAKSASSAR
jgi:hypothetical protein